MPARAAIWPKVTGCPAAASSAQAASTRASSPRSAGMGLGDEQVEPVDEAAVAGGFGAPAAGGGVGGEGFGVGALQLQYRAELGLGQGECAGVFVADGGVEQPAIAQAHLR